MKNIFLFTLLLTTACSPTQKCVEKINPDCICTLQYDPVCGCNNKTYSNACAAACAGIKTYTKGECPQAGALPLEGMVWQLSSFAIAPQPQQVPDNVTISIKFEGGKIQGHGGCNNVGGTYQLNGNKLRVSELMSTKMYCEHASKWESMFLAQLEHCSAYAINGEQLELSCGDKGSLVFRSNWKKRKGE